MLFNILKGPLVLNFNKINKFYDGCLEKHDVSN